MNKKVLFIMSDFETSKISEDINDGVYAWLTGFKVSGLMDFEYTPKTKISKEKYTKREWINVRDYLPYIPLEFKYFHGKDSLKQWLNAIFEICSYCKVKGIEVKVFFHNAQYDFSYIQYLILNEFEGYTKKQYKKGVYIGKTIIDDTNTFYQATITNKNILKGSNNKRIQHTLSFTIHDLYKILPSPLADIGQSVGIEKLKEIFDYTRIIPYDYIPSDDDIKYFYNDIEIMNIAYKKLPSFFFGYYTIGSIAKNYFIDNHVNKSDDLKQSKLFPVNEICTEFDFYNVNDVRILNYIQFKDVNKEILKGYKGGMTIVNKDYLGKTLYNKNLPIKYIPERDKEFINDNLIYHYDVNSLYPSAMCDETYPVGVPRIYYNSCDNLQEFEKFLINLMNEGKKIIIQVDITQGNIKQGKAPLFLKHCDNTMGIDNKSDNIISLDNSYKAFYEKISFKTEVITLEEFLLLKQNYNFENYIIQIAYVFNAMKNLFTGYVDEISKLKIENDNDEFLRTCYKLMLNNLYGKFGENNDKKNLKRFLDSDGNWYTNNVHDYDDKEGNIITETISDYFYPPIAVYVTSYARMKMIRFINLIGWSNVIYMDTDSIHCIGDRCKKLLEKNGFVDNVKLGLLKLEDICHGEKAISPKKYCYYGNKLKKNKTDFFVKCAGLPGDAQKEIKDFNQFSYGLTFIPKEFINEENKTYINKNKKGISKEIELPPNYIPSSKLQKKLVKGGIYLSDAIFSIKTPDYILIKNESNFLNSVQDIETYVI